jgi:formylglycine-generating enzyme
VRWRSAAWIALVMAPGCNGRTADELPPLGQIVLHVDTDAHVPAAPGDREGPGEPPFLFDRLRIEVLRGEAVVPGTVALADRDFAVHRGRFRGGPVSIGILPPVGDDSLVVRARLFRADHVRGLEPAAPAVIETRMRLPAVGPEGLVHMSVLLATDDVGRPRGAPEALPPDLRSTGSSRVGTWAGAKITSCSSPAGDGEVCVSGGAFWMGDPDVKGIPNTEDADQEHLVVVSPFFLDDTEVTVRRFLEVWPQLEATGHAAPPTWSGQSTGENIDDFSTFGVPGTLPQERMDLPVVSVPWSTARAYCQLRGRDLPSEAMLEFVASNRGWETRYAWGNESPECGDASFARAGYGTYERYSGYCRPPSIIGGPEPPGSTARDRITIVDPVDAVPRTLHDLAGNVTEWSLDAWYPQGQGPWAEKGPLVDPVGQAAGIPDEKRVARGGSWRGGAADLLAASRQAFVPEDPNRSVGFRCARR